MKNSFLPSKSAPKEIAEQFANFRFREDYKGDGQGLNKPDFKQNNGRYLEVTMMEHNVGILLKGTKAQRSSHGAYGLK